MITRIHTSADLERMIGPLTFGSVLRAWRECEELSQRELAKRLGVTASTLADLEAGRRIPSLKRAEAIAKKMGAPIASWVKLALVDYINKSGVAVAFKIEAA